MTEVSQRSHWERSWNSDPIAFDIDRQHDGTLQAMHHLLRALAESFVGSIQKARWPQQPVFSNAREVITMVLTTKIRLPRAESGFLDWIRTGGSFLLDLFG